MARGNITEFIDGYVESDMTRLHMPGHKGKAVPGYGDGLNVMFERDITEIEGADALYEASGIIGESEKRMAEVFGTAATFYSAGGSSQSIKAMCFLAIRYWKTRVMSTKGKGGSESVIPIIVAGRNAHISFIHAAGLLGFDIRWLEPGDSLCESAVTSEQLHAYLKKLEIEGELPRVAAVMVTSPDYLGNMLDIRGISETAHAFGCLCMVDNAHGAYLAMLEENLHPIRLGADMTADSAHKTLSVLTGGSFLNISKQAPDELEKDAKEALLIFGSTSPSYLIMESMDMNLPYLEEQKELLKDSENDFQIAARKVGALKEKLSVDGWDIYGTEPLKLTVKCPGRGELLSGELRSRGIECEFADRDFLVMMWSPANPEEDYIKVQNAFKEIGVEQVCDKENSEKKDADIPEFCLPEVKYQYRDLLFSDYEVTDVDKSLGRVSMEVAAKCPPAILPVIPGEVIDENIVRILKYYGINRIRVKAGK